MINELELLTRADPVGDRAMPAASPAALGAILSKARARRARRRLAAATGVVAVGATILLGLDVVAAPTGAPALAAPAPLEVRPSSIPTSLAILARAAAGASGRTVRGSHLQEWALTAWADGEVPTVEVPEERLTTWNPDGSSARVTVAVDPRHRDRPVIDATDPARVPETVPNGTITSRRTLPPAEAAQLAMYPTAPPETAAAMTRYLLAHHQDAATSTYALVQAVVDLRNEWVLGPAAQSALLQVLAQRTDLRHVGEITDWLGRRGEGFAVGSGDLFTEPSDMLLVVDRSGRVLAAQTTFTADSPTFRVPAGSVLQYTAWIN